MIWIMVIAMSDDWTKGLYKFVVFKKAKEEYEKGNTEESARLLNKLKGEE